MKAKQYGDSYLVLKDVRLRCTMCSTDSGGRRARRHCTSRNLESCFWTQREHAATIKIKLRINMKQLKPSKAQ